MALFHYKSIYIILLAFITLTYTEEPSLCAESQCPDSVVNFHINDTCSNCSHCWSRHYSYCTFLQQDEASYCICGHKVPSDCTLTKVIEKLDDVGDLDYTCYNSTIEIAPPPKLTVIHSNANNFTVGVPNIQNLDYWRELNIKSFDLQVYCEEAVCTESFKDFVNETFLLEEISLLETNETIVRQNKARRLGVPFRWSNFLKDDAPDNPDLGVSVEYRLGYDKSYLAPDGSDGVVEKWKLEPIHSEPLPISKPSPLSDVPSTMKGINPGLIILIIILTLLFIGMILACITRRHTMRHLASQKKQKQKKVQQKTDTVVYNPKLESAQREEEWKLLPTSLNADKFESNSPLKSAQKNDIMHKYVDVCRNATIIPLSQLDLLEIIGQGQFGPIKRGYIGQKNECMVHCTKMPYLGNAEDAKNFMEQLDSSVKASSHPNIISFAGLCDQGEDLYIAMQLESGPNLRNLLRESRSIENFLQYAKAHGRISLMSSQRLLSIMLGVARGMGYLEENKVLHDNLAAVNIVIGENGTPKIGGFGMATLSDLYTRQIGKNHKRLRWLPPETLTEHLFSLKSQIWSFGVVLWEIVTLGGSPYYEMNDKDVMNKVPMGIRLTKPLNCSFQLYDLMTNCWKHEAESRPNFVEILRILQEFNLNPEEHIDLTYANDFMYEPIKQVYTEAL